MTAADEDDQQARDWETLYERLVDLLLQFGTEDGERTADCWVFDENWGTLQHKIYIRNLKLLHPAVVKSLQGLLADFPSWEIVVAVSVPGPDDAWPDMGLIIRADEILDNLQRHYFPKEFQGFEYEGSRRG